MNKMLDVVLRKQTSEKVSQRVALGVNIEERSEVGSVFQAERIYRIGLIQGRFL